MAMREKFGRLVLLEELESSALGIEYRAAKLGPAGLERILTVLRLQPGLSGNAEAARRLMEQTKIAAQLQNPNILKILGIGRVDQSYYISYEYVEGRSLRAVLGRCRQEAFPFSVEHALLIASKVCSGLEHAHVRRSDSGERYFHGQLTPANVLVSYEGEVRVRGFGCWPSRVRECVPIGPEEQRYLAPEQMAGEGDHRSDVYALGAVLFEKLTGQAPEGEADLDSQLASAKVASASGDEGSLPPAIADILRRSLARDPAARYAEASEMRKAIDTLLFSGDFTPTTFNLAFFMHSLHREEIERETRTLREEREASYVEYLAEEPARPAPPPVPAPVVPSPEAEAAERPSRAAAEISLPPEPAAPRPPAVTSHPRPDISPGLGSRDATAGFTFHKKEGAHRPKAWLAVAALLLVLIGGGLAYYLGLRPSAPPATPAQAPPPTLSPEALAAQARVKELEQKLAALEAEKAAAEAKAAEEAKQSMEARARAKGERIDPEKVQRAQEEARRRAKEEQERRQLAEMRRLEEERVAEEARLAEERRKAEEQARLAEAAAAASPTPAPVAAPTPMAPPETMPPAPTPPPLQPGALVSLSDPGVIPPALERSPTLSYPLIAQRQRIDGVVELNVLVDEKGQVVEAQIVSGVGSKAGLNEAAIDNVKKRRYRPARKDGVPVKVWISVRVKFELPQ